MSARTSVFIRPSLWALLAAICGTVVWILLVATVAPLVAGDGIGKMAGWWSTRAIAGFYFGGFIAALAIVPHALLFSAWLLVMRRYPILQRRIGGPSLSSLLLSLPLVLVVFGSFAAPSFGLGPFWSEAFNALPWVLLSTWGGIFFGQVLVRSRDHRQLPVAA